MFDPDAFLKNLRQTHPRLLFYPSCGSQLLSCVLRLPYDVFIFADYGPKSQYERSDFWQAIVAEPKRLPFRTYDPNRWYYENSRRNPELPLTLTYSTVRTRVFQYGNKWGVLFFQDNNEVLQRIVQSGYRLSAFVGIRDGCAEGGNYECVNEMPFLGKVLSASMDGMDYFTDHSSILEEPEKSFQGIDHRWFRKSIQIEGKENLHMEFRLTDLLWRSNGQRSSRHDPCSYGTRSNGTFRSSHPRCCGTCSLLWNLLPFRTNHAEGILAHYNVNHEQQMLP